MNTEQHWKYFHEYCKYEKMTGGPDPHITCAAEMCKGLPYREQVWRILVYMGVYNVPTAELLWTEWPSQRYMRHSYDLLAWLENNWRGLEFRRERRTVRSPEKLFAYLSSYDQMCRDLVDLRGAPFEVVWEWTKNLPHVGRYAAIKLTELWYRRGMIAHRIPDLRAKGGWSPREGLGLLVGAENLPDPKDDSRDAVARTEEMAVEVRHRLYVGYELDLNDYEYEVLLCNYKSSAKTQRHYPGRSLDSELGYEAKIQELWPDRPSPSEHMRVRRRLFPEWALGEIQGWSGVRKELGSMLHNSGVTWSDFLYKYEEISK